MKIQNILNEDFGTPAQSARPTQGIRFNDLNTLQVRTLMRMANGEVDVDSANDNEYDIMADLVDLGLLDNEYNLSDRGQKAVAIAKKVGGSAELAQARQKAQMRNTQQEPTDIDPPALDTMGIDTTEVLPDEDDDDVIDFNISRQR